MKKANSIEQELNTIRAGLHEEMKGMSPSEMTTYMKEQTEPTLKNMVLYLLAVQILNPM